MARITVTVCDKCETQDGVDTYEIRQSDRKAKMDLCSKHAAPLEEIMNLVSPKPAVQRRKPTTPRTPAKSRVTTIEEIEAMKKK